MTGRAVVTLLAIWCLALLPTPSRAIDGCPAAVRVLNPFGENSVPALAFSVVEDAFAEESGAQVELLSTGLHDALAEVAAGEEEVVPLLLVEVFSFVSFDSETPVLQRLEPLAKLTPGVSRVLLVPAGGPIGSVDALFARAAPRTLVVGIGNPFAPELVMLQSYAGLPVQAVIGLSVDAIVSSLDGIADAALLTTPSFLRLRARAPGRYVPLMTFGGGRNKVLDLPTLREISGERDMATTSSVALFHRRGLAPAVAACLRGALAAAAARADVGKAAAGAGLALDVQGPDVVNATMERDRRILQRVRKAEPVAWTMLEDAR